MTTSQHEFWFPFVHDFLAGGRRQPQDFDMNDFMSGSEKIIAVLTNPNNGSLQQNSHMLPGVNGCSKLVGGNQLSHTALNVVALANRAGVPFTNNVPLLRTWSGTGSLVMNPAHAVMVLLALSMGQTLTGGNHKGVLTALRSITVAYIKRAMSFLSDGQLVRRAWDVAKTHGMLVPLHENRTIYTRLEAELTGLIGELARQEAVLAGHQRKVSSNRLTLALFHGFVDTTLKVGQQSVVLVHTHIPLYYMCLNVYPMFIVLCFHSKPTLSITIDNMQPVTILSSCMSPPRCVWLTSTKIAEARHSRFSDAVFDHMLLFIHHTKNGPAFPHVVHPSQVVAAYGINKRRQYALTLMNGQSVTVTKKNSDALLLFADYIHTVDISHWIAMMDYLWIRYRCPKNEREIELYTLLKKYARNGGRPLLEFCLAVVLALNAGGPLSVINQQ